MFITLAIWQTLGNIIIFLLVLSLVINIHELGHLFFAKRAGILCHEFAFGMGPRLWSKKVGETIYSIRAIPFGGFVSMAGEEIESDIVKIGQKIRLGFDQDNEVNRIILNSADTNYHDFLEVKVEQVDLSSEAGNRLFINEYTVKRNAMYVDGKTHLQIAPKDRSFSYKTKWQRFSATFGGPLMNFVLAFIVFLTMSFIIGVPDYDSSVIADVSEGSPAAEILQAGDKIISINGVDVTSWGGESNSVNSELSKDVNSYVIVVERDGSIVTLQAISPQYIFYGLGFTSTVGTDELIIDTPLYLDTEIASGDIILSIDGIAMNSWDDVIAYSDAHQNGSTDENPTVIEVERSVTYATVEGLVTDVSVDATTGYVTITVLKDECNFFCQVFGREYTTMILKGGETDLINVGAHIDANTPVGRNAVYTISYVAYGSDVLDAQGYDYFYSRIGITSSSKFSFFGSFGTAWSSFVNAGTSIFKTIGLMFSSDQVGVSDLSGFVGIFSMTSRAAAGGFVSLLSWIGFLSINLGIVNLLPIPALDGGRLVFIGYEAITKKRPNQKFENLLHTIMFFLLMGFLIFITYNDILRLFGIK